MTSTDKRLFAKFTLDFPTNPKIAGLSDAAFRALVEAVCYSRQHLTDGFIPSAVARKMWGDVVLAELRTNHPDRPSLTEDDGGFRIHDYASHQLTAADIRSLQERGRKGGQAKAEARRLAPASDRPELRAGNGTASALQSQESEMTTASFPESSHYSTARDATDGIDATTARLAGQQGITDLGAVISAADSHVDRRLDASGALRLSLHILGKAASTPTNALPYVLRSIERSPAEVQQFIDKEAIAL